MKWYTLSEAAKIIGYAQSATLRAYLKKGLVKGRKVKPKNGYGYYWKISETEVMKRKVIHELETKDK